ncbi:hypothetical protein [Cellulomonas bogoriensis]|uniref:Uncharacterized protein n=1 Tax=Cellulomonas bogoriensis 69B4 = DSM 16987 TaxID=1386082 RepID=A0A0A0BS08_9CELL|nr:hypothetical protein [Cellulomonas bogoriensis]KGM10457.1 hypothetical protein N869_04790 [Cellulomonas bogoriensis 69B4 = DSM 16987]
MTTTQTPTGWWQRRRTHPMDRRARTMRKWAGALGWTWVGSDPSLVGRWTGFPFIGGTSVRTTEVMNGAYRGRPALSFVYSATFETPQGFAAFAHHVLAVALPVALPTLQIMPETPGRIGGTWPEWHDLVTESDDFNRTWRVSSEDPRYAHDVITPRLMARLLEPRSAGHHLRIEGSDIVSWQEGTTCTAGMAERLNTLCSVAEAIPRFVWRDHGYDPPID